MIIWIYLYCMYCSRVLNVQPQKGPRLAIWVMTPEEAKGAPLEVDLESETCNEFRLLFETKQSERKTLMVVVCNTGSTAIYFSLEVQILIIRIGFNLVEVFIRKSNMAGWVTRILWEPVSLRGNIFLFPCGTSCSESVILVAWLLTCRIELCRSNASMLTLTALALLLRKLSCYLSPSKAILLDSIRSNLAFFSFPLSIFWYPPFFTPHKGKFTWLLWFIQVSNFALGFWTRETHLQKAFMLPSCDSPGAPPNYE